MSDRPYVLLSCAMSVDGYIDDVSPQRLVLSGDADWDRVDEVRAGCDAVMVGANTIRRDNPRLLVKSQARREARAARGLPPTPARVVISAGGDLDPAARVFNPGEGAVMVYAGSAAAESARERLAGVAEVADAGDPVDLGRVLDDLVARRVGRLMVEGGGRLHTAFLTAGLADELHLAVAPLFVGDSRAPRFVGDGRFPWNAERRARLAEVRQVGDVALLRYALSDRFGG